MKPATRIEVWSFGIFGVGYGAGHADAAGVPFFPWFVVAVPLLAASKWLLDKAIDDYAKDRTP